MFDRHLFLTGMPGSGKSSLGRRVAAEMNLPFIDTDREITTILGCGVGEIYERYGESAFRNAETNLLIALARQSPMLVSTGGGMVIQPRNQELMRNLGVILFVDRPLEDILSDIKLDRRPMLAAKGLDEVRRLYEERIGTYRATADLVLDNSHGYQAGLDEMKRLIRRQYGL